MSDWLRWLLIAAAVLAAVVLVVARRGPRLPALPRVGGGISLSVLGWLVIAGVVAVGTGGGLLWFLGWPRLPTAGVFAVDQLLDLLKIALSVVAGFGGVVLLAVNYRKQRVTENEHALAVEKAGREAVQGFNERLGTAAEQLAHDSPAVRLTGVYALAGLADDWADKRQVCVDVLCGYLRLQPDVVTPGEEEVRQAILRMVRDRLSRYLGTWRALDFDFTGVRFENADFAGLGFEGLVNFDGAEFTGELTTFAGSSFSGALSCHGTVFGADRTTFGSARFDGRAEFVGCDFTGRVLHFSGGHLARQSVAFYRCRFRTELLDFSAVSILSGELRFEQLEFADTELVFDVSDGWTAGAGGFPRLVFEDVRFLRCRFGLELQADQERMVWLIDSVLDTVTLSIAKWEGIRPWLVPRGGERWLNLRNVECRGGTEIPDRHVRHRTLA
ncbi:hypothetical protein GCM10027258_20280 [Amycolatopsis stemonae]